MCVMESLANKASALFNKYSDLSDSISFSPTKQCDAFKKKLQQLLILRDIASLFGSLTRIKQPD